MRQTLLILGASGDLTARLLLPGLGGLLKSVHAKDLGLVGAGSDDWDDERWRSLVEKATGMSGLDTRYLKADVTAEEDLRRLLDACEGQAVVYFALPPRVTAKACEALTRVGVPDGTSLVMEKPFGTDAESARRLNELLAQLVPEDHVHRVDHFLGTSTVLNIFGVRFANRIVEPVLNAAHVESVEIVFDETLALEGRAGYYDGAGALVDMIQSHLLQVLALVAMDPPPTLHATDVRDAKAQVLRATRVWDGDPVRSSGRGRYTAGSIDGHELPSYVDEEGVDPKRKTETFAEVVVEVDTWRWSGVPFRLRSGKALGSPRAEVAVTFKPPQRLPEGLTGSDRPDRLRMGIGLDAGSIALDIDISGPGDPFGLDPATLEASFGAGELPPYGEVLKSLLAGDPLLTVRGDTAVQCWRIIEPVQAAWRADRVPLQDYPAGSSGPGTQAG
ncbi:MAG TPA: glucose-6-phosphate dehydrogenase [Thermoleophilaceae bacterium]|nr:glucose-6-phosphate dehydrogenase [Thermoleophilaceae bacterium]